MDPGWIAIQPHPHSNGHERRNEGTWRKEKAKVKRGARFASWKIGQKRNPDKGEIGNMTGERREREELEGS